jgi:hypothetical protein
MGMLSVFELRKAIVQVPAAFQQQQQPQGSNASGMVDELRYELILHGLVPLQCTPASACTVVPRDLPVYHSQQQQQQQQPGPAAATHPAASAAQASAAAAGHQAPADAAAAAAVASPPASPLLVVGSEVGVTLLRLLVDDAAVADQQQLEQLLTHTQQVRHGRRLGLAFELDGMGHVVFNVRLLG